MTLDRSGGKGRILTGARCRFSVNGKVIGYARNVNISESLQYEPIETLDNLEVEEHVPVGYAVTMSASMFRLVGSTLKSEGLFPSNGANAEEHLRNVLLQSGIMAATVEDTKTGKVISEVSNVRVTTHNWGIDARGVVGEDVEFVAIRVSDESEIAS